MCEIIFGENFNVIILLFGFMGVLLVIDIICVGSSGILLVINIVIVYKDVGVGMIGVGIVYLFFVCFEKVIFGWCECYGV